MTDLLAHLSLFLAQHAPVPHVGTGHGGVAGASAVAAGIQAPLGQLPDLVTGYLPVAGIVPLLPLLGCVLCALCAIFRVRTKLPAIITVGLLAVSFFITFVTYQSTTALPGAQHAVVHLWDWINFNWYTPGEAGKPIAHAIVANFSFYIDPLTCLWMLFVTGLATLIALYAGEYMSHDQGPGYCRFFVAFNLFVFSMACLVMGDNLLLLFLGWEGVGLCSYLLIGYFYQKPSAVAAGKKAFIMNRIGDLGLSMGIMLTYVQFGTVEYARLFPMLQTYLEAAQHGHFDRIPALVQLIPVLFTIGAFGKSAQFPLYVWLPDAMEGPTPVSALIHAATMVTAGVYLVARFFPLYLLGGHPFAFLTDSALLSWASHLSALDIVAWGGAITALLAATIGMAQFDIKRIMAYSTVSQLGYMFCGLGVLGAVGGVGHVFTHAFFKALLFLACGAVMHGFAGQLDLRKLSGVGFMKGWGVVAVTMLVGCINLAGVPIITAGFYSKDTILGDAFSNPHTRPIGWILLFTAGLTAYYTFRVFFRVFVGPKHYEPGDEVNAHDDHAIQNPGGHAGAVVARAHHNSHDPHDHGPDHDHGPGSESRATQDFHPHPPGLAINTVLVILAIATFAAIPLVLHLDNEHWVGHMVLSSTAGVAPPHHEHLGAFGFEDAHKAMQWVSGIVAILGITIAFFLHYLGRTSAATSRADALLPMLGPIPKWAQHKWYVDEFYDAVIVKPLRVLSHIFHLIDKLLVDGVVNLFGLLPRIAGSLVRRQQTGVLHDYAVSMAAGITLVILVVILFKGGVV